jgi:DNA-binding LytR/AlgR family response regulator
MNIFNCLIVDDEPIARDIIINYCSHLPLLHILDVCENALEAKNILQEQNVDILFLDIHLPILDGISLLKVLKNTPQVIFTTAFKEYAVNAFDLEACDYLVKPFSLERFIVAVDKAIERLNASERKTLMKNANEENYLFFKTDGKIYKIKHDDILYAEAKGNYTKIVTNNLIITPNISFTKFEKMLPAIIFVRVHRSFIINKSKIDHIEGNRLFINKVEIPIGSNYRDRFLKYLGL